MTAAAQVLQLVRAHFRRDETAFLSAATILARAAKTPSIRNGILETLRRGYESGPRPSSGGFGGASGGALQPARVASSDLLQPLPAIGFADLMLEPALQLFLDEIVTELEYREELTSRKLSPRCRFLFHGPPGNGKTSSAAALANALGVTAYGASIPRVVSMYMGGTGQNLAALFDTLAADTCVVFDELDALGATRGAVDQAAGKEANAIVNVLLTLLDRERRGILIATTNRPDILDPALLRRFDEVIAFPAPSPAQMAALAERLCGQFEIEPVPVESCRNFDEVTKTVLREARRCVMRELLAAEDDANDEGESDDGVEPTTH